MKIEYFRKKVKLNKMEYNSKNVEILFQIISKC